MKRILFTGLRVTSVLPVPFMDDVTSMKDIPFKNRMELPDMLLLDINQSETPKRWRNGINELVRTKPKIGRNESCPCGSGKKYKNCCYGK